MLMPLAFAVAIAAAGDAPVSLTTAEGVGLRMVAYSADAVVAGPLAYTELRLTFENPEDRVIEGRFRLVLPDGAAISRFAMKIDGAFMEGEVVEKQAARRAYEDFLHRRQDPALLEQASPNEFSARVFPIPARGQKEIIVSYSQELTSSSTPYRLALVGLPEVGAFRVRVRDGARVLLDEQKSRFVPGKDVVVAVAGGGVVRSDDVVVARVVPVDKGVAAEAMGGTLILVDTSASRALGHDADVRLVRELVVALAPKVAPGAPLHVVAYDQVQEEMHAGTFQNAGNLERLRARRALGASDLEAALAFAAGRAKAAGLSRLVVVTDGVVTAGADGSALAGAEKALSAAGVTRVDAIAVGGIRDLEGLKRLVAAGTSGGAVLDGGLAAADLALRLLLRTQSGLAVEVSGARFVWPKRLDGVQPGDEVLIVAELPASAALSVRVGGRPVVIEAARAAPAPLVRRAWARATVARLEESRAQASTEAAKAEIAAHIVQVSTKHRVLSPLTALLVLETEADYARFGIDRKSLVDILVVDDAGLALQKRADVVVAQAPPPAPKPAPNANVEKKSRAADDSLASAGASDAGAEREVARSAPTRRRVDYDPRTVEAGPPPPPPPPPPAAARSPTPRGSFLAEPAPAGPPSAPARRIRADDDDSEPRERRRESSAPRAVVDPYSGAFAEVMALIKAGKAKDAQQRARGWREEAPGDLLALLALGEAHEAAGDLVEAARAYGSLIDLFADRADIRRLAGARLDRVAGKRADAGAAATLAADTWGRAAADQPDHPQGPRGHAWALARLGRFEAALRALEGAQGADRSRFPGVARIVVDDAGLIGAMAKKAGAKNVDEALGRLGARAAQQPSLRFVLWWETDTNDVDFHVHDKAGDHAWYSNKSLKSGGRLYEDVTQGFGPEAFVIESAKRAYPYRLEAHYYARGPMGFGMGAVRVIEHDGRGGVLVDDRPFVIMVDGATVALGDVVGPLPR